MRAVRQCRSARSSAAASISVSTIFVRRKLVARPDGAHAAEQAPAVAAGGDVGEQAFRLHRHGEALEVGRLDYAHVAFAEPCVIAHEARRGGDDRGEREGQNGQREGHRRLQALQLRMEQEGGNHGQGNAVRLGILRQEHQSHRRQECSGDGEPQRRLLAPPQPRGKVRPPRTRRRIRRHSRRSR